MNKNLLFYFTGTGNSLKIAKDIGTKLTNCELISMGLNHTYSLDQTYNSIGFIYPTYFQGIPIKVSKFINSLDFKKNTNTYIYGISNCGKFVGNAITQLKDILIKKDINLSYGTKIDMVSNYIVMYSPSKNIAEKAVEYSKDIIPITSNIINKKSNSIGNSNPLLNWYYNQRVKKVPYMDKDYNVSDQCISCEICKNICPVNNIEFVDNKPCFLHHCEQCTSCIQFCPKKAINYKNKTQNRKRYVHKDIVYKDLLLKTISIP